MKSLIICLLAITALPALAHAQKYDRLLNKQEVARLLPKYVALVESKAGVVPSPADKLAYFSAVTMVLNPHYGVFDRDHGFIGMQTHDADTISEAIASGAAEAKAISVAERTSSNLDVIGGFRSPRDRKISCRLGYHSKFSTHPTERLVKCVDDRSVPERGEEEGYFDQRVMILSIDAQTLEPIAVYSLEHNSAG